MPDGECLIEQQLAACLRVCQITPARVTSWEHAFLASVADRNETLHLTDAQVAKLAEIHQRLAGRP